MKTYTPMCIIITPLKTSDKEKVLKAAKKKQVQKNKDKDDIRFLVRSNTTKRTVEQHF